MDGGAWWLAVHGVASSRTRLSDFTFTFHFHALEKEMATHSSVLAWRIPGTGEPGGLPSMGSHRVRHDWSDLAASSSSRSSTRRSNTLTTQKSSFFNTNTVLLKLKKHITFQCFYINNQASLFCLFNKGASNLKVIKLAWFTGVYHLLNEFIWRIWMQSKHNGTQPPFGKVNHVAWEEDKGKLSWRELVLLSLWV